MKFNQKDITRNAMIGALYFVLTLITYPISFLGIQFRFAEILILLCFFRKDYIFGLTIGCVLANLCSSIGPIDALFGAVTTIMACILIGFCKQLAVACIIPIVTNAFFIGYELYAVLNEPFWISVGQVALGELAVMVVGYLLFVYLRRRKWFYSSIKAEQNIDFKF